MLARAGDGHGDVEVGGDGLAGQAHLVAGRHPARVHCRAGGAHRAAQQLGQFFQLGKGFRAAQAAAARHYDAGVFQFDAFGFFLDHLNDPAADQGVVQVNREGYYLARPGGVGFRGGVNLGPHRRHLGGLVATDDGHGVAAIDRAVGEELARGSVCRNFQAVLGQADAQPEGQPGGNFAAHVGAGDEDDGRVGFLAEGFGGGQVQFHLELGQGRVGYGINLVGAQGDGGLSQAVHRVAKNSDGQFLAQVVGHLAAGSQNFLGGKTQLVSLGFSDNQDTVSLRHGNLRC